VPTVDNVVVLMPPLVKNTKARAIFIRRTDGKPLDLEGCAVSIPNVTADVKKLGREDTAMLTLAYDLVDQPLIEHEVLTAFEVGCGHIEGRGCGAGQWIA